MLVRNHTSETAFGARRLASSEVISRAKLEKSINFLLIVPDIVVFGAILFNLCGIY